MVDVVSGSHHHLKGRDQLTAGCAVPCHPKEPQVVPAAEDEVGPGVEGGAHPAQAAVTASTFQTVLMPVPVQRLQHEAVPDLPVAAGTAPRLLSGLEGHERHTLLLIQHHPSGNRQKSNNRRNATASSPACAITRPKSDNKHTRALPLCIQSQRGVAQTSAPLIMTQKKAQRNSH